MAQVQGSVGVGPGNGDENALGQRRASSCEPPLKHPLVGEIAGGAGVCILP